ncbi:putative phage abortive infection protein [Aliarcobacter butzleri]|uniref:putative phage abortive infection protein n=1 Tax=Aliarcobacter butzleri TaxID=28197 RepID=UPI00166CB784|nr:putative phage abortive infection protein [Aliarcobacter butzleri]GGT78533.1 hypothetical protein GCM10007985_13630 [Aliarcobacter butzleri]
MKKNKSFKEKINNSFKEWWGIIFIAFIAMLIIFIFGYFYFSKHSLSWLSGEVEELGQMGDFFGGTLNPILAFLSFCLLLITIKLQSKELKNSTEELAKSSKALIEQSKSLKIQNFETTFFNLINLHNKIVDNFSFERYNFFSLYKGKLEFNSNKSALFYKEEAFNEICKDIDFISKEQKLYFMKFNEFYDLYYIEKQRVLNKYFENINQIFKFISDSNFNDEEKKKYSDIFRVQFSQDELKLLFYHCISSIGSVMLKKYIENFKFFEFLIFEKENKNFLFIINKNIYIDKAFKDNENVEIKKTINKYLETTKLNINSDNYFKDFIKYCTYLFFLEKYDLILKKFDELKIKSNEILENFNISEETKKKTKENISSIDYYTNQIKEYFNEKQ